MTRRAKLKKKRGPLLPATTVFRHILFDEVRHYSLLEVMLLTGRQHQIRRHFRSTGHPVLGDKKYGYRRVNLHHRIEHGISSLALHALSLTIPHPDTDEKLHFVARLPKDLLRSMERMEIREKVITQLMNNQDLSWSKDLLSLSLDQKN